MLDPYPPGTVFQKKREDTKVSQGTSPVVQWLRLCLPMQGVWVQSLVGELRFHMPDVRKNQGIKQKQYCNKFNEDLKNNKIAQEPTKELPMAEAGTV